MSLDFLPIAYAPLPSSTVIVRSPENKFAIGVLNHVLDFFDKTTGGDGVPVACELDSPKRPIQKVPPLAVVTRPPGSTSRFLASLVTRVGGSPRSALLAQFPVTTPPPAVTVIVSGRASGTRLLLATVMVVKPVSDEPSARR